MRVGTSRGSAETFTLFALRPGETPPGRADEPQAPRIAPAIDGEIASGGREWHYAAPHVVLAGETWLSVEHTQGGGIESFQPLRAFAFEPGFRMRLRCELELHDARGRDIAPLLDSPARLNLDALLREMSGDEGDCGSGSFLLKRIRDRGLAVRRRIVRPWDPQEPFNPASFEQVLAEWRVAGPGHAAVADRVPAAILAWQRVLENFYRRGFGVTADVADAWAASAVQAELGHGFSARDYVHEPRSRRDALVAAVQASRTPDDIARAMATWQASATPAESLPADALHIAVVENPRMLRPLLQHGFDIDVGNGFGKTALMYAAQGDRLEMIEELLSLGADPVWATTPPEDRCYYSIGTDGVTALHYAARYASPAVVETLVAAGAGIDSADSSGRTPMEWVLTYRVGDRALDEVGFERMSRTLAPPR